MKVRLTREHIRKGIRSRVGGSCPMYWAISETLSNPNIHVESQWVCLVPSGEEAYLLPQAARNWINEWDSSEMLESSIDPIEFELVHK